MNDACSIAEFCEGGRRDHDLEGSLDSAITAGIASAKPAGDIADPDHRLQLATAARLLGVPGVDRGPRA